MGISFSTKRGISMGKFVKQFVLMTVVMLIFGVTGAAGGNIEFEPVRAPSVGPDNASVTVYEIADFM
jgi:hypothetical protein